jgi:hypothetical protein
VITLGLYKVNNVAGWELSSVDELVDVMVVVVSSPIMIKSEVIDSWPKDDVTVVVVLLVEVDDVVVEVVDVTVVVRVVGPSVV